MKFPQFLEIFRPDLYRYDGDTGFLYFLKHWLRVVLRLIWGNRHQWRSSDGLHFLSQVSKDVSV